MLATIVVCAGCSQVPEAGPIDRDFLSGGPVVAKVGPLVLHAEELSRRVGKESALARSRLAAPEGLERFVRSQAHFELMLLEAMAQGIDREPQTAKAYTRILVERLVSRERARLEDGIEVDEAALRLAYTKRRAEFVKPGAVRVAQIVRRFDSASGAVAAERRLREIQSEIRRRETANEVGAFYRIAQAEVEASPESAGSGDLGYVTRAALTDRYTAEIAAAVFDRLKTGDSVILRADDAAALFKKTGARRAINRSFESVKAQLRADVLRQKREEAFRAYLTSLEKKHELEVWSEHLGAIVQSGGERAEAPH